MPVLQPSAATGAATEPPRTVAVFATCLADTAMPAAAEATVEVLEAMGCTVVVPAGQTCCGQVAINSGHPDEGRRLARHWLRVFDGYAAVVTPSGSCAATVHHQYPRLLSGTEADAAAALAERTLEFSQFVARYGAGLRLRLPTTVTYHDACHMLRVLGERDAPREVLGRIDGLQVREMTGAEVCCGFGGAFASALPDVSVAMADAKLADVAATGAEWLVSADGGCLLHLRTRAARTGRPVRTSHLAELVRDALSDGAPAGNRR